MDNEKNFLRSKKTIHELEEFSGSSGKTSAAIYYYMLAYTIEKSAKKSFVNGNAKDFLLTLMNDN